MKHSIHPRTLNTSTKHASQRPSVGDEIFTTGIFYFNISAILAWLEENPHGVIDAPVGIWPCSKPKDEVFVAQADITRPIVIAEIAPDYRGIRPEVSIDHKRPEMPFECICSEIPFDDWIARGYSLVDGYHRVEKAKRLGMTSLPAIV